MFISSAFAQTAAPAAGAQGNMIGLIAPVGLLIVFYFLMIRPQMKKQKEQRAMVDNLAKGDEIVTNGGLLGRITKLSETILHVEVAPGTEVQVQRSAVLQVLPKGSYK